MDKIARAKALGWTVEQQVDETFTGVLVRYWMLVRPDGSDYFDAWGVSTEAEAWAALPADFEEGSG